MNDIDRMEEFERIIDTLVSGSDDADADRDALIRLITKRLGADVTMLLLGDSLDRVKMGLHRIGTNHLVAQDAVLRVVMDLGETAIPNLATLFCISGNPAITTPYTLTIPAHHADDVAKELVDLMAERQLLSDVVGAVTVSSDPQDPNVGPDDPATHLTGLMVLKVSLEDGVREFVVFKFPLDRDDDGNVLFSIEDDDFTLIRVDADSLDDPVGHIILSGMEAILES